jgi:hypothetical protein
MMLPYAGNGAYCHANSLYMSLLGAGANADELPGPGFLECLTTVPFGNMYLSLENGPLVFFSGANIDPDDGLTRALHAPGWSCKLYRGRSQEEAMAHLKEAAAAGSALVGPIDMGWLSYNPGHAHMMGGDHFVVVLDMDVETWMLPRFCSKPTGKRRQRSWSSRRRFRPGAIPGSASPMARSCRDHGADWRVRE